MEDELLKTINSCKQSLNAKCYNNIKKKFQLKLYGVTNVELRHAKLTITTVKVIITKNHNSYKFEFDNAYVHEFACNEDKYNELDNVDDIMFYMVFGDKYELIEILKYIDNIYHNDCHVTTIVKSDYIPLPMTIEELKKTINNCKSQLHDIYAREYIKIQEDKKCLKISD